MIERLIRVPTPNDNFMYTVKYYAKLRQIGLHETADIIQNADWLRAVDTTVAHANCGNVSTLQQLLSLRLGIDYKVKEEE